jgi:acetylornithine aminotransferase
MLGTTFGGNHLACAAAIAVLEVMENENLISNAEKIGNYLLAEIKKLSEHTGTGLENVRGKGLMIGFDVSGELNDLKKNLLQKHKIFTGAAKPNVIRLLPSLALTQNDADIFLQALRAEVATLIPERITF